MGSLDQEHLRVILLNTKNQVLGIQEVHIGDVNSSVIRVAEVLWPAIRDNRPSVIVVHNHPSGDPPPSPEDIPVTARLRETGETMDIDVLDHIIIGGQRFFDLREKRLGF